MQLAEFTTPDGCPIIPTRRRLRNEKDPTEKMGALEAGCKTLIW